MNLTQADRDAGKRLSEAVTLHLLADIGNVGHWVAFKLEDGSTDNTAYPSRGDAAAHQSNELLCGYLVITPDGITPKDAAVYVAYNRRLYAKGYRMPDPQTQTRLWRKQ